jgi:23S rRNA pseudouridine2605 synthase
MPGLSRVLSKLGFCSRSAGAALARAGRVTVDGVIRRDPEFPVQLERQVITVDGELVTVAPPTYLIFNKPRGLVTTASDEKGRPTVFSGLTNAPDAHLSPVGRLDQASEGLLLFTNDTAWANAITDPSRHLNKTYHVQINRLPDPTLLATLETGVQTDDGPLSAKRATLLREGEKNAWLEIILDEGRNRHIRRLFEALQIEVLRLIRTAIGSVTLGDLEKGTSRKLTPTEVKALSLKPPRPARPARRPPPKHRGAPPDRTPPGRKSPPGSR